MNIDWQYKSGFSGDNGAFRMYRDDGLKVQKEVITKRNRRSGNWGKSKTYYFRDNDPNEYGSEMELIEAVKKGEP